MPRKHDPDGGHSRNGETAVAPHCVDRKPFGRELRSGDATATECAQNLMRTAELFLDADTRGLRRHGLSIAARILLAKVAAGIEAPDVDEVVATARPRKRPRR